MTELNLRLISKIVDRLEIGCSICGWKESTRDIHHILPRSKGGNNEFFNLCVLCPNCHRLAHTGKILTFLSFADQVGDRWKTVYDINAKNKAHELFGRIGKGEISKISSARKALAQENANAKIELLKASKIDFSKYGWVKEAAAIIEISPQKTRKWIEIYCPFLLEKSFSRKTK